MTAGVAGGFSTSLYGDAPFINHPALDPQIGAWVTLTSPLLPSVAGGDVVDDIGIYVSNHTGQTIGVDLALLVANAAGTQIIRVLGSAGTVPDGGVSVPVPGWSGASVSAIAGTDLQFVTGDRIVTTAGGIYAATLIVGASTT